MERTVRNPTMKALDYLRNRSNTALLLGGVVAVIGVGYFDAVTPPELLFSFFYLLPISLITWLAGKRYGVGLALFSAVTRIIADFHGASVSDSPAVVCGNAVLTLGVSLFIVVLVSSLKELSEQLEKKVAERTATLWREVAKRQRAGQAIRKLAALLADAEQAERRRLAADLHDSIGQSLTMLKLKLEMTAKQIRDDGAPAEGLTELVPMVDTIIQQTRTFTFHLHPAMLEDLGLVPTLHSYCEEFTAHTNIRAAVTEIGTAQALPAPVAAFLFRSIKELLNNSLKHGRSREVLVQVQWRDDEVRIVIDDDGCGFDVARTLASQERRGLGLSGIRERLAALAGELCIESEVGKGTRVILEVPLARVAVEAPAADGNDAPTPSRREPAEVLYDESSSASG